MIVGFPEETDQEFEQTYEFLKELKLYETHIFKYSPRNGTKAAEMPDQVDPSVKNSRSECLIKLNEKNKKDFEDLHVGQIFRIYS